MGTAAIMCVVWRSSIVIGPPAEHEELSVVEMTDTDMVSVASTI
jgi:hypothetical protein